MNRVLKVKIGEFKVLENLDVDLGGKHVLLLGDNGVGKSSFLQFIKIAMGDKSAVPPKTNGRGEVVVEKDGQKITFRLIEIKSGKPIIEVQGEDGFVDSRKSVIQSLAGGENFDINEFVKWSSSESGRKKQVQAYKSLLPQDVQDFINEQEYRVQEAYEERTMVGRQQKEVDGFIKDHPLWHELQLMKGELEPKDVSALQQELISISETNEQIAGVKQRMSMNIDRSGRIDGEIEELQAKIAALKEEGKDLADKIGKATKYLQQNQEGSKDDVLSKIRSAEDHNKRVSDFRFLKEKHVELEKIGNKYGELSALIDASRQLVADTIRDMAEDGPVPGLSFDSDRLIWNGVFVDENSISTSEKIELGILLMMAKNPDFGVLLLEHIESVGTKRLKTISEIANKRGWQLIMEQVQRGEEKLKIEIFNDETI